MRALDDILQIADYILLPKGRMDCVIVAVAHDEFTKMKLEDLTRRMKDKPVLIDVRGMFNNQEANSKGYLYKTL